MSQNKILSFLLELGGCFGKFWDYKSKIRMKKICIIILLIISSLNIFAQENESEKKTEKDPLKNAEAAFDKAFDGLFKTKKKSEDPKKQEPVAKEKEVEKKESKGSFGGFSFGGKPKANYSFVSSMTMKISSTPAKEKTATIMRSKYLFGADDKAVGVKFLNSSNADMQKSQATIEMFLMDFEQNKFFTFTNNEGTKNVMAIGYKPDKLEQYATENDEKIKITKTTETKTIAGYKCEGYRIEDQESKDQVLMWISQNKVGDFAKMGQKMGGNAGMTGKGNSKNYMAYTAHPELAKIMAQGRAVLGYSIRSEKGDQTDMEVEEIKVNDKFTFDTAPYKSMF